ncbi:MAG: ABC transporter ATP-binding protein [Gammaproteobacteria bacterium]|jgi:ABC-2 type transport system ATP-binding protein
MKALSITNLKKEYTGGLQALKGIDLNVEKGDFFALLGPNGAGKSTTIGIISSLVTKTSGEVKILDIDIDENHSLAKKKLGVVGQEVNFNQFEKVGDIIRNQAGYYGLSFKQARDNAKYYMRKLDIWDKRNEQARKLSGGMKRRVMVAKALVNNPDLLILDEPTAGVDIELRRSLWDFLTEINDQGTTIILTTHYLEEAERLCRNIAIIDSGEIVENTSMQELLTRLEVETFVFDLSTPITDLPKSLDFEMLLENPQKLKVTVGKGQGLNSVFEILSNSGIQISSMRNETGRLEELFLGLVDSTLTNEKE